jgi:hypothetical protein
VSTHTRIIRHKSLLSSNHLVHRGDIVYNMIILGLASHYLHMILFADEMKAM